MNRNGNGEIGQERSASLMGGLGFGPQAAVASSSAQASRSGNGLLNAVTASARTSEVRSPVGTYFYADMLMYCTDCCLGTRPSDGMPPISDDDARRKSSSAQLGLSDAASLSTEMRNPLGAIGNDGSGSKAIDFPADASSSAAHAQDPLAGMSDADKFGIKGLLALMAKYPAYNALVHGMNPAEFGLDLSSEESVSSRSMPSLPMPSTAVLTGNRKFSEMSMSLFDHAPPKPVQPKFSLPECYTVRNTQPIEQKVTNFTEETLLFMFYSNPQSKHQFLAAQQLYLRGWRWHKTMRCWLTKDTEMQPVLIAPETERGYYVIWNTSTWSRERVSTILVDFLPSFIANTYCRENLSWCTKILRTSLMPTAHLMHNSHGCRRESRWEPTSYDPPRPAVR